MALDSKEMMEEMSGLAVKYGLDAVILRPELKRSWEYDKSGKLVKKDVSPFKTSKAGRRCYCMPDPDHGEGMWSCTVYTRNDATNTDVALEQFRHQFPD